VRTKTHLWLGILGIVLFTVVFLVPFAFILFTAAKTQTEAGELQFSLPTTWALLQNFGDALRTRDYMLVIAFINSTVLTVVSITILVVLSAMVAYVVQHRQSRWNGVINFLVLSGLIIPPAVVPTVWVLQELGCSRPSGASSSSRSPSGCRSASCCSAPSSPPFPGTSTRRRSSTGPVRSGCSSRSSSRC
jgi:raffinose/stachyose/melibiose transport system permease protein